MGGHPAFDVALRCHVHCQGPGRNILSDDRSRSRIRSIADSNRSDEHVVRARARVSAHLGAVLVDAVVVGRNRAGANVGALADRGVADVREVRHFGPAAEGGVLHLDESAHFALVADDGTRT